jgi:predicted Fe-Mo cluster-binding NifX family protein
MVLALGKAEVTIMRLAIPLFGSEVAPRFGCAERILVADLREDGSWEEAAQSLGLLPWPARLQHLAQLGVTVLLCGGFNRHWLPLAESLGIRVIWGLWGDARELISAFHAGRLQTPPAFGHGGRGRGRGGHGGRGRGRRGPFHRED